MTAQPIVTKQITATDGVLVYLFTIVANLAAQVVFSFLIGGIGLVTGSPVAENTYFQLLGMLLIQVFYLAVVALYFGIARKRPLLRYGFRQRVSPVGVVLALAVTVLCMLCFYLPAAWFATLLETIGYASSGGVALETPLQIVFGMVLMVGTAPLFEELIFRGFLLSGLKRKMGDVGAVLLSGLAFSLMHMNPEQTVYQFLLGCACGWVAVKTGSLVLPVIMHAGSNLLALLFELTPLGNAFGFLMDALTVNWWVSLLSTVALFAAGTVGIYYLGKVFVRTAPPLRPLVESPAAETAAAPNTSADKLVAVVYGGAIALSFVMWLLVFAMSMLSGHGIGV